MFSPDGTRVVPQASMDRAGVGRSDRPAAGRSAHASGQDEERRVQSRRQARGQERAASRSTGANCDARRVQVSRRDHKIRPPGGARRLGGGALGWKPQAPPGGLHDCRKRCVVPVVDDPRMIRWTALLLSELVEPAIYGVL